MQCSLIGNKRAFSVEKCETKSSFVYYSGKQTSSHE